MVWIPLEGKGSRHSPVCIDGPSFPLFVSQATMISQTMANGPPRQALRNAAGIANVMGPSTKPTTPSHGVPAHHHAAVNADHDKYQRLLEENHSLKVLRNEQDDTIKKLNTKFERLLRDFNAGRCVPQKGDEGNGGSRRSASPDALRRAVKERDDAILQLREAQRLIEQLQHENRQLRALWPAGQAGVIGAPPVPAVSTTSPPRATSSNSSGGGQGAELQRLKAQMAIDAAKAEALTEERNQLRAQLQLQLAQSGGQSAAAAMASNALARINEDRLAHDVMQLRHQLAAANAANDSLTRDRDTLNAQLESMRLRQPQQSGGGFGRLASSTGATGSPSVDGVVVHDLDAQLFQHTTADKSSQLAVLASRLETQRQQLVTLTGECDRLVVELKSMHQTCTDLKRRCFTLETEKASADARAQRALELESTLNLKQEELVRVEQELLRMIDALQACGRDTEMRVRAECSSRFMDMERMKDEADRSRRSKEREAFGLAQEVTDLKRIVHGANEDVAEARNRLLEVVKERDRLADEVARLSRADPGGAVSAGALKAAEMKATEALRNVLDGAEWNERWEAEKMREALAHANLELELANQRCSSFQDTLDDLKAQLALLQKEREALLEENLRLRRDSSGIDIQSVEKRRLVQRTLRVAEDDASCSVPASPNLPTAIQPNQLSIALVDVTWETCLVNSLTRPTVDTETSASSGDSPFATSLFFTLDGPVGYESAVSESFPFAQGTANRSPGPSTVFVFNDMGANLSAAQVAQLRREPFVLQLHQVVGDGGSRTVGCGQFALPQIVAARTTGSGLQVPMTDGATVTGIGCVTVTLHGVDAPLGEWLRASDEDSRVSGLVPQEATDSAAVTLSRGLPRNGLTESTTWTQAMSRAALLVLRAVRGLRVHVIRCRGLTAETAEGGPRRIPVPYVYYTATSRLGDPAPGCFIGDTIVHTRHRIQSLDADFDVVPNEHVRSMDEAMLDFVLGGKITFAVFDINSTDARESLGVAECALAPLVLAATLPTTRRPPEPADASSVTPGTQRTVGVGLAAAIHVVDKLHPCGTLEYVISWLA